MFHEGPRVHEYILGDYHQYRFIKELNMLIEMQKELPKEQEIIYTWDLHDIIDRIDACIRHGKKVNKQKTEFYKVIKEKRKEIRLVIIEIERKYPSALE